MRAVGTFSQDPVRALLDPGFREVGLEGSEITINQYLDATAERESAGTKLNQFFDHAYLTIYLNFLLESYF